MKLGLGMARNCLNIELENTYKNANGKKQIADTMEEALFDTGCNIEGYIREDIVNKLYLTIRRYERENDIVQDYSGTTFGFYEGEVEGVNIRITDSNNVEHEFVAQSLRVQKDLAKPVVLGKPFTDKCKLAAVGKELMHVEEKWRAELNEHKEEDGTLVCVSEAKYSSKNVHKKIIDQH